MSIEDPFEERKEAAGKEAEQAEALEKAHMANLLGSISGRWLLGKLYAEWAAMENKPVQGNSQDAYHAARRLAVRPYRELIIKHFGNAGIDKLLKG